MHTYSSLSRKNFTFFVPPEIRTGSFLNNERMAQYWPHMACLIHILLNSNTIYSDGEWNVTCKGDIHNDFDGYCLPHVAVESVHADWVRAHATFTLLWAGCDSVFLQCNTPVYERTYGIIVLRVQPTRTLKQRHIFSNVRTSMVWTL